MTKRTRLHESERRLLKRLKSERSVVEMAVEEGLIEDTRDPLSYDELLRLAIPEDAEPMERNGVVVIDIPDMKDEVARLSGENVPEHRVVRRYAVELAKEHEVPVNLHE